MVAADEDVAGRGKGIKRVNKTQTSLQKVANEIFRKMKRLSKMYGGVWCGEDEDE